MNKMTIVASVLGLLLPSVAFSYGVTCPLVLT